MSTALKANGMNKPKRKQERRQFGLPDDAIVSKKDISIPPRTRRYVPPICTACTALRISEGLDPNENKSYCYHTKTESGYKFHFWRCDYCGNTGKDPEKLP